MKYNEIMERIRVDEAMRGRVLQKVSEAAEGAAEPAKVTDLKGRLTVKRVLPVAAAACLLLIIGSAAASGVFSRSNAETSAPQSAAAVEEYARESDEMAEDAYAADEAAEEDAGSPAAVNALTSAEGEAAAEEKAFDKSEEESAGETEEAAAGDEAVAEGGTDLEETAETPAEEAADVSGGTSEMTEAGAKAEADSAASESSGTGVSTGAEADSAASESSGTGVSTGAEADSAASESSGTGVSTGAEADSADSSSFDTAGTAVQAGTITELSELAGFEVRGLTNLPFEVTAVTYLYQAGQGARIVYGTVGEEAVYTVSDRQGTADVSSYEDVMVIHSSGREIVLCGADREYTLAVWEADGHACSLELTRARGQAVWRRIRFA